MLHLKLDNVWLLICPINPSMIILSSYVDQQQQISKIKKYANGVQKIPQPHPSPLTAWNSHALPHVERQHINPSMSLLIVVVIIQIKVTFRKQVK